MCCDHTERVLGSYRAVCWDHIERCVGTIQSDVLGPHRAVCWDHTERCVGTIQSGVLGPYRAVCWDHTERCVVTIQSGVLGPYREGQVSALNGVQKRAANFANNINESGWETLAQRRLIARIRALFKAYTSGRALKAIGDRLLKPSYLSRGDLSRKIRTRKQRTDVGKYSFVIRTFKSWNQLPKTY